MSRARRARRIAANAAFGGGIGAAGAGALGLTAYGVMNVEAKLARRVVGTPFDDAPLSSGIYGHGTGDAVRFLVLGDSTAKGMGAESKHQTIGGVIASAVAALTARPVDLLNVAVVGAQSTDLDRQLEEAFASMPSPEVALILVGANDVTHRLDRATAVRHLSVAVHRLRASGAEVVVGTCPDLGVIRPLPQPLRLLAQRWSRDLAAAQTVSVVESGGRTVSLGDLIGPEFRAHPAEMFSKDQFHPSPAGYARAASALLPSVLDALGLPSVDTNRGPDRLRGESIGPVAAAAERAVQKPGSEVSATKVHGSDRGRAGRWAMVLRRHHAEVPDTAHSSETESESMTETEASGSGPSSETSAVSRSTD